MSEPVRPALPSAEELKTISPDGGPNWNRLVFEKSPYLLQHASNPVDWYPWGEEAFKAAREQDKPIFLSIGYSTCHWCHVMEHESFEDSEVAELMNQYFISIKVDREERPDIDSVYMTVTQALTGSGGWPMTVILTPDKQPFYAGTYFAKYSRYDRRGMMDLLPGIGNAWKNDRVNAVKAASEITQALARMTAGAPGDALTSETLQEGFHQLSESFDDDGGGFGHAPKFPTPHNFSFLLRYWKRTGDAAALEMVEKTLSSMRRGGIFDHVGFGFHRYSTDPEWLVPHFEKMLYDQAMLTIACIETYQAMGKEEYAQTAREILAYVMRDMTSPEGGFYSAEDADSEGVEGKFYLWSPEEVVSLLGKEEGELFSKIYNIVEGGNFREEATGHGTGGSIPHLQKPLSEMAKELNLDESSLASRLEASRRKLFAAREKRIHPLKDDKILTDWNGLMIAAMAKAAKALDDPQYADAARRAADF
ncbi:MAG: thioredoxin domain-containing protein, partial [bacterium]